MSRKGWIKSWIVVVLTIAFSLTPLLVLGFTVRGGGEFPESIPLPADDPGSPRPPDIEGFFAYRAGKLRGVVTIKSVGEGSSFYSVVWSTVDGGVTKGIGRLEASTLAVLWKSGKQHGVSVYTIAERGRVLTGGGFAVTESDDGMSVSLSGTEVLRRIKLLVDEI